MPKLKARDMKWLKGFHLFAVSCWVGGGVALFMLYFLKTKALEGNLLFGTIQTVFLILIFFISIFKPWGKRT